MVAVAVSGMHPNRPHRPPVEVAERGVDVVEQHRVRTVLRSAAGSRSGVHEKVAYLVCHLVEEGGKRLVSPNRHPEGEDLDKEACRFLEAARGATVRRGQDGQVGLPGDSGHAGEQRRRDQVELGHPRHKPAGTVSGEVDEAVDSISAQNYCHSLGSGGAIGMGCDTVEGRLRHRCLRLLLPEGLGLCVGRRGPGSLLVVGVALESGVVVAGCVVQAALRRCSV